MLCKHLSHTIWSQNGKWNPRVQDMKPASVQGRLQNCMCTRPATKLQVYKAGYETASAQGRLQICKCTRPTTKLKVYKTGYKYASAQGRLQNFKCTRPATKLQVYKAAYKTSSVQGRLQIYKCITPATKLQVHKAGYKTTSVQGRLQNCTCTRPATKLKSVQGRLRNTRFYVSEQHLQTPYWPTYINLNDNCRQSLPASSLLLKSSTCNDQRVSHSRRKPFPANTWNMVRKPVYHDLQYTAPRGVTCDSRQIGTVANTAMPNVARNCRTDGWHSLPDKIISLYIHKWGTMFDRLQAVIT